MFLPIVMNPPYVQDHINSAINERQAMTGWASKIISERDLNRIYSGDSVNPSSVPYSPSAQGLGYDRGHVSAVDYLNADMAKHYKMGKSSAYQEALANTSYQRSVADMKAAGLNPAVLYGAGRGQPASSSVYASSGSGGRGGRYGGRASSDDKTFSGSAYSAIQAIGGLIGLGLTKRPDGFWIGSQTAKGAMGLIDSLSRK